MLHVVMLCLAHKIPDRLAQADGGEFPLITTSEEQKWHSRWTFDAEAICVPTVSSTGHGHASIKRIHYVSGKFSAATITAVMCKKKDADIHVPYVYWYLLAHKDELLVPLMRGSANVSLSDERLGKLRIPVPGKTKQLALVKDLVQIRVQETETKNRLKALEQAAEESLEALRQSF